MLSAVRSSAGLHSTISNLAQEDADWTLGNVPAANDTFRLFHRLLRRLFATTSRVRALALVIIYSLITAGSLLGAYLIGFDFAVPPEFIVAGLLSALWFIPLKLAILYAFGQWRGFLSYFRLPDLLRLSRAVAVCFFILIVLRFLFGWEAAFPRRIIFLESVFSLASLAAFRLAMRTLRERFHNDEPHGRSRHIAILGANELGESFAAELSRRPAFGMKPVLFFDSNVARDGRMLHGLEVLNHQQHSLEALREDYRLDGIVVAERLDPVGLNRLLADAHRADLTVELIEERSVRAFDRGTLSPQDVRSVQLDDLLGRPSTQMDSTAVERLLGRQTVLVTGAGGSIGRELCVQCLNAGSTRLLAVDRSETLLFQTEQHLARLGLGGRFVSLLADVTDEPRMRSILSKFQPQTVFHAAAHKHVPMMESQPTEAFKNNTLGTARLAKCCSESGIERFVLISTDKAINPTSAMGASKRLAELAIIDRQRTPGNTTRFMAVRFGNVLGSSGSVIPIFQEQITRGGPVTVTHPEIKRYFMTITEAVGLVLQSAVLGEGGDIFWLDMGELVPIVDIAEKLIRIAGFEPGREIAIEFTGLRPGEKLFEELFHQGDNLQQTTHPRIMRVTDSSECSASFDPWLENIRANLDQHEVDAFKDLMGNFIPEYEPFKT